MKLFAVGYYPTSIHDDGFHEIVIANERPYTDEEFLQHAKDANDNIEDKYSTWDIVNYLIEKYNYYEPKITSYDVIEDNILK